MNGNILAAIAAVCTGAGVAIIVWLKLKTKPAPAPVQVELANKPEAEPLRIQAEVANKPAPPAVPPPRREVGFHTSMDAPAHEEEKPPQ